MVSVVSRVARLRAGLFKSVLIIQEIGFNARRISTAAVHRPTSGVVFRLFGVLIPGFRGGSSGGFVGAGAGILGG